MRDAVVSGVIVALAIGLGATTVFEKARFEKMADVRRHISEMARRFSALVPVEDLDGSPAAAARLQRMVALTAERLQFLRDNATEMRRAYTFSLDPAEKQTRVDTGKSGEKSGPRPLPKHAELARAHYENTRRDPQRPGWLATEGDESTAFFLLQRRKDAAESAIAIEADTEQLLIGLASIRQALWFTWFVGLGVGAGFGFVVWRMRKRSAAVQAELAESRNLEDAAITSLGAATYTFDPRNRRFHWRGNIAGLRDALPGPDGERAGTWLEHLHPDDRPRYAEAMAKAFEQNEPMELEYRVLRAGRPNAWVLDRNRPLRLHDGEIHLVGSLLDLTARRRAEEALRLFFDETATAHLALDGDTIVDANPAAVALFGATDKAALLAQPAWALWPRRQPTHALSAEAWAERVMAAVEAGSSRFEWQFQRLDGAVVDCDVFFRHAVFQDREVLMMGCSDISAAKRAQARLIESEQRFRDVSEAVGEFIWEVDREGRYTYASSRVVEVLGLSPDDVLGRTPFDFIPPEAIDLVRERSTAIIGKGVPFRNLEHRVRRADGALLWISVSGVPSFDASGEIAGYRGASLDVTAHRSSEQELVLQKEAAEAAGRAKGNFLAMMSHEIRTPLNSVLGFADLLLETPLDPTQHSYLETIKSSGDALLVLLNDILDFSKIESGQMEVEIRATDVRQCVDEVVTLYRPAAVAKDLAVTVEFTDDIPPAVLTDPSRLRQILLNLVGNAVKFTPKGRVTLEVTLQPPPIGEGEKRIRIVVSDTGIGIGEEQQARLFNPFTQADSSTTRRFGGTGLGLAISRRLATLLGGHLDFHERPGPGAAFAVEFPALIPADGEPPDSAAASPDFPPVSRAPNGDGRNLRVLVVDDNPLNRRLTSKLLHLLGADTDAAGSARECFEKIVAAPFDVVLMDVQMPGMDGLEATRRIRTGEAGVGGATLPIVALTADAMIGDRERCLAAGMNEYLTKPLRRDELARVLAAYSAR